MLNDDGNDPLRNPYATPAGDFNEPKGVDFSAEEFRPFRTIWTRPRDTVRRIIAINPALHVLPLVCIGGIGQALDRAAIRSAGDNLSIAAIVGIAVVFGPLGGLLGLWIGSHLIRLSGMLIGGIGNRTHIKTAIAWASVPAVCALPLWIPQLALFGSDMFTSATPRLDAQPMLLIPFLFFGFVEIVLGIWGFVLLCNTIAEVQGFRSAWRGLGNLLLALALIFVPLMLLVFGVVVLSSV